MLTPSALHPPLEANNFLQNCLYKCSNPYNNIIAHNAINILFLFSGKPRINLCFGVDIHRKPPKDYKVKCLAMSYGNEELFLISCLFYLTGMGD